MLLLTGPAGSGKTSFVLEQFTQALEHGAAGVRLLTPTATMAQHLRNRIARAGFLLRPQMVETLSRFVETWADRPQVSEAHFYLIVEAAVRAVKRPEFARVAHMPGFCAALARTLEEFASAGCDARRLSENLPDTPLGEASAAVYAEVERELERRGVALRAARLERVAARIRAEGMPGISSIWLDGFHSLPDPELTVIEAMSRCADVTVTLPSAEVTAETRTRLLALGFVEQAMERTRPRAQVDVVEAASIEREADAIARRILEEAAAGRAFREMGIIVRNAETYGPVLRAVLGRFGIPARFYLDAELASHGVTRFLAGIVDALAGGWDHAAALGALRLDPAAGSSDAMDRFDFAVRSRMPGRGLGGLKELADAAVAPLVARLEPLDEWRRAPVMPAEWAARLASLAAWYRPPLGDGASRERVLMWRSQAAAVSAFRDAMSETAAWFGDARAISLGEFWRAAKAVLRLSPLRLQDERRNVVHVLSAYEARQWELAVVFVCGLVEKQFPHYAPQNAFFPDAARRELRRGGVRLRTTADSEAEEAFLFDAAVSRARDAVLLSYPKYDSRGEENLRSGFLEAFPETVGAGPAVLPCVESLGDREVARRPGGPPHTPLVMRVTALESFVQCPFQYFGRHTLRLEEPPVRPEDRLDFRLQGNLVHNVVAEWTRSPQPIEELFERMFADMCRKERIPRGYRTETLRTQMRADLARFAVQARPRGAGTLVEEPFEFELEDGVRLRGRIDRLDRSEDGCAEVVDYKYSKQASDQAKDVNRLQGPLYLLAAQKVFGVESASVWLCGLRGAVKYVAAPVTPERVESAVATALRSAGEIRDGVTVAHPADPEKCRYCTYRDVCRYKAAAAIGTAGSV